MYRNGFVRSGIRISAFLCLLAITLFAVSGISGCGGKATVGVTLTASLTTVDAGDTLTITASVSNDSNSEGVTWSTSGGKLSNQSATGVTFTAPAATSSVQTVTITATSVADTTKTATLMLTIPAAPKITTGSLTAGTVGSNYSATLTVTGGIPPYTWTLISGTLPSCLTIVNSASGTSITGTLTAACAGTYNLTFKVSDSGTPTPLTATTATLSLTIAAAPAITFVGAMPATAAYGAAYTGSAAATGGAGALTYSVGGGALPTGLSLDTTSGAVTGTPTAVGAFNFTIKAADGFGDSATSTTYTVVVGSEKPTLSFAAIPTQTYGNMPFTVSATSASSGAVTYSVTSGPATVSGSTVTLTGVGTVVLGASQAASGNYAAATASASFTVNPETPTLKFAAIPTQTYGVAPFAVSATSASTGAITYSVTSGPATISGATVTITGVGTVALSASQAAFGPYAAATTTTSFMVNAETPTLTFAAITPQSFGAAPFIVSASSASTGPITYSVTSGPATISGATVTLTGVGTVALSASQAASGDFAAATTTTSFMVSPGTPALTFAAIPTQTFGNAPFTVSAASASNGAVTYSVTSGPATISGATVTITGAGTVTLGASQAAFGNYTAATAAASFIVNPETPILTFAAIPAQTYGNMPFTVSASSASTGPITYSVTSGPATISGATVTLTGVGTVVVSASQAAFGNFAAATTSTSFTVAGEVTTLTFAAIPIKTYGAAPFNVSASSASNGAITYSVTSGPATISGATVTITGAGTVVLGANQAGSGDYAPATTTTSFTVNPATPILTFASIPAQTFGEVPFMVSASSASAGAVTYSVTSGAATISGATVTLTGAGTVVLGASQAATANYTAATTAISFTVNPGTPILTFASIPTETYGNAPFTVSASSASTGAITYSVSSGPATISGSTVTLTGVGLVTLSASQAAFGSYTAATASTNFTVNAETPTLTFAAIPSKTFGDPSFTVSASSPSSGAITYSVSSGPATISGATLTLTGAGAVVLGASQVANGDYAAATAMTSFTVNPAVSITTASPLPTGVVNTPYSQALAASGGSGGYSWTTDVAGTNSLASVNLTLSQGGVVSGTPLSAATATFAATVTDSTSHSATVTLTVKITNALTITTTTLPAATTNALYSQTLTAAGGTGLGYAWTTTGANNLATFNLTLSGGGLLSGTPTATGTASFTAQVKDSGNNTATQALTVPVYAPLALPAANPITLGQATTNLAYSGTIVATGGSGSGYVFTVTGLPFDGLQNAANNGSSTLTIGGTATLTQTVTFQVSVKDGLGNTAGPVTYTIAVKPPAPLTLQAGGALAGATTNAAYNAMVVASGGSGSGYVFSVNGAQIPGNGASVLIADGISVSNAGGNSLVITGTPTLTQTVTITSVTVKDSAGDNAGPDTYTIAVNPPAPLMLQAAGPLAGATTGQSYNASIVASGGSGSGYVFSVNGTAIPNNGTAQVIADGIAVSSLGGNTLSVTGVPTTTQTVTITNVTVKDSANDSAGPDTYTIAVNPATPLTLQSSGPLPGATTGQSYNTSINASGGSGSGYVFTVNGSQIPINGTAVLIADGISVSNLGGSSLSISGTPTLTQTVTLTNVTVKDSANDTAGPDTYTIAVNPPGSSVSGQILLENGCNAPALPAFTLSINTNPVQQTTTDSGGNYTFTGIPYGTYTITPSISGASSVFNPATQTGVLVNSSSVGVGIFGASVGYTVSGTVSYSGAKTGQVYLVLNNGCGGNPTGTSITEAELKSGGAFTIRGVTPGSYTLQTWMDDLGYGAPNANDPAGSTSSFTVTDANLPGVSVNLTDPVAVTLSTGPTLQSVSPFSEGVVVPFKPIQSNGVELASSYTLEWSVTAGFTAIAGQTSFAATGVNGSGVWFVNVNHVTGLLAGSTYYFRAQGVAGSSTSPWSSTIGPVTIAAPSGGVTVTGTVNFTGTATGPLYAGFYNQKTNTVYATVIGSQASPPTSGASYTVDVPPGGNYVNFGIVDQNNDGMVDPGDIDNVNGNGPQSSVTIPNTGPVTEPPLTLPSGNSIAALTTAKTVGTNQGGTYTSYSINFTVSGVVKLPVAVALVSATNPDVVLPVDIGECTNCGNGNGQFSYYSNLTGYTPNVGDSYGLQVTYSDGTQETLPVTVGTVLSAAASNLAPNLTTSNVSLTPTFTWTDPANAANYTYSFTLWDQNGNQIWQIPGNNSNSNGFSSAITSITWPNDPTGGGSTPSVPSLSSNGTYMWQIQVADSSGNVTQTQASFTTPEGNLSLPAANTNPLGSALINVPYSGGIVATGGSGSGYSFTVNGNTVPSNATPLTLTDGLSAVNSSSSALLISGTPTTATGVSLTVSVEDGQGHTAGPVTYTLPVSAGPNGANNSYLSGQYVCSLGGFLDSNSSRWASLFSFTANGAAGTFTNGIFDSNGNSYAADVTGTATGTYSVGSDNNGLATLNTSVGTIGGATTSKWAIALTNFAGPTASEFELVEADDLGSPPSGHHGTGQCLRATPSAFIASTISGHSFAFQISGEDSAGGPRIDLGRFSASNGSVTTGVTDQVKGTQGKLGNTAFTGSYILPTTPSFATYGRYTLTFTDTTGSVNYAVYTIDATRMFLLLSDAGDGTAAGQMRTQQQATYSAANLNGNFVLFEEGYEVSSGVYSGSYSQVYQGAGDGAGNLTINASYMDDNGTFAVGSADGTLPVTFDTVNPGRVTFAPGGGSGFIYMYDNNSAFIMTASSNGDADAGSIEAQTQTTFTDAAVAGNYMLGGLPPESPEAPGTVGEFDVLASGATTGNLSTAGEGYFSFDQPGSGLSYSWLSNVYGVLSIADGGSALDTCVVITSSKTACIGNTSSLPSITILQQ